MFGLLVAALPRLQDGLQADAVAMTPEGHDPDQGAAKTVSQAAGGMRCLLAAPWGRLILGDDPVPVALLLVFALLLLPPILGVGLGFFLLLAAAALLRAWLWCRGRRGDQDA